MMLSCNIRDHLLAMQWVKDWSHVFPAPPPNVSPEQVLSTAQEVRLNGSTLVLSHCGPAHTDSRISVRFVEADVFYAGDTLWNGTYPFIDYSTGGHINETIATAKANLAAATDSTIIIPGHGAPLGNRGQLRDVRDMLVDIRAVIAALKKQGLSLKAIITARPRSTMRNGGNS